MLALIVHALSCWQRLYSRGTGLEKLKCPIFNYQKGQLTWPRFSRYYCRSTDTAGTVAGKSNPRRHILNFNIIRQDLYKKEISFRAFSFCIRQGGNVDLLEWFDLKLYDRFLADRELLFPIAQPSAQMPCPYSCGKLLLKLDGIELRMNTPDLI